MASLLKRITSDGLRPNWRLVRSIRDNLVKLWWHLLYDDGQFCCRDSRTFTVCRALRKREYSISAVYFFFSGNIVFFFIKIVPTAHLCHYCGVWRMSIVWVEICVQSGRYLKLSEKRPPFWKLFLEKKSAVSTVLWPSLSFSLCMRQVFPLLFVLCLCLTLL